MLGSRGAELVIRKSDPSARKRFTFAHELGHWVLSNTRDCEVRFDGSIPSHVSHHHSRSSPEETWCNEFASRLLVPTTEVQEFLSGPLDHVPNKLSDGHRKFEVSEDAFLFRIADITGWIILHLAHGSNLHRIGKRYISRTQSRPHVEQSMSELLEITRTDAVFLGTKVSLSDCVAYGTLKSRSRETDTYLVCLMPNV